VQCIYGSDDDDDVACPALQGTGAEVVQLPGDHHFDENYDLLTKTIIDALRRRLQN
jgi:type IV secretory pathway VirJ component